MLTRHGHDNGPQHAEPLFIVGAKDLAETEAGKIYRRELNLIHGQIKDNIPQPVLELIGENVNNAEKYRRGLALKMIQNSPNPFPMIGKPSSMFIFIDRKGVSYLDYLVEKPEFVRKYSMHHSLMTKFDASSGNNNYHPDSLKFREAFWSGHVASIISDYKNLDFSHIALLDKFSQRNDFYPADQMLINMLHFNGFLPVTAHGQILNHKQ